MLYIHIIYKYMLQILICRDECIFGDIPCPIGGGWRVLCGLTILFF
jgi:hypothetical protein